MKNKRDAHKEGTTRVWLDSADTIICALEGYITEAVARSAMHETQRLANALRQKEKTPLLLIDMRKVTGQTSGARSAAKEIGKFGLSKIALFGTDKFLTAVGQYIATAGGMGGYTRFFATQTQARRWLHAESVQTSTDATLRIVIAFIVVLIAGASLFGWALGVPLLRAITPGFRAMNPVAALNLLTLAIAIGFIRQKGMGRARTRVLKIIAWWSTLFGIAIITRYFMEWNLGIDAWLFRDSLQSSYVSGLTSLSSGVAFTLFGGMLILVLTGQRNKWQQYVFHTFSVILFLWLVITILITVFGLQKMRSPNSLFSMPVNSAICFLLLNHALQTVNRPLSFFATAKRRFDLYFPVIVVFTLTIILTGVAWRQSNDDLQDRKKAIAQEEFDRTQNAIRDRYTAYVNALRGFKAFFESSDQVTVDEFHTYFTNSELTKYYPGFNAISFIANVPVEQKTQFIAEVQAMQGILRPAYRNFTIQTGSPNPFLYPVVYTEPSGTGSGNDLSLNSERRQTLERARDTGEPTATGDISLLNQDPNATPRIGFFISVPIYKQAGSSLTTVEQRRQNLLGFVNAVFENKVLLGDIFAPNNNPALRYVVTSATTNQQLYVHNSQGQSIQSVPTLQQTIGLGGQQWTTALYTTKDYGVGFMDRMLPYILLLGGFVLSIFAALLVLNQSRRRQEALALAARMTEDLNNERNNAVATQQKDEAILSSIGDAVFAIDTKSRLTLFNGMAERLSGWTANEASGRPYKEVLPFVFEKTGRENDQFIRQALNGQVAAMHNHTLLVRRDGSRVAVADSAAPIRDSRGKILGAIIVFRDVSREQELDRAKSEFVSLASHQLRTPLSAINWYGEMLLNGDAGKLKPTQEEYLKEIYEGNQRMIELVNSLLDVSRLDLGKLVNAPTPTSLPELLQSLQREMITSIKNKKLKVVIKISSPLPDVVADPKLLRMITQNLFSNAVKYTSEKGDVTIEARTASENECRAAKVRTPNDKHLFLSITDTGYGIPKNQQDKIFGKFFRADNVQALDVEGTGLGLYIVKQVVEKLGGKVWFQSTENAGTTFFVILPFKTKQILPQNDTIQKSKGRR